MNSHVSIANDDFTPITDRARAMLRQIRLQGCMVFERVETAEQIALSELRSAGYVSKSIDIQQGKPATLNVQITEAGARYLDRIMRAH